MIAAKQLALDFGKKSEDLVANYLSKNGWLILARNYRTRRGEIDLIALEQQSLVFVEVRARGSFSFHPIYSVTKSKQKKCFLAAQHYLQKQSSKWEPQEIRFDLILVEGSIVQEHIKGWH